MSVVEVIIIGMIVIIIATVTLAVLSYLAFKLRDRRTTRTAAHPLADAPMFFERVRVSAPVRSREG